MVHVAGEKGGADDESNGKRGEQNDTVAALFLQVVGKSAGSNAILAKKSNGCFGHGKDQCGHA